MEQSYASAAKSLISKYKRASFDKIEKDELNSKLADLAEEQEAHRVIEGIDSKTQMWGGGPVDKYGIGQSHNPNNYARDLSGNMLFDSTNPVAYSDSLGLKLDKPVLYGEPSKFGQNVAPDNGVISEYKTSLAPSMISAAASTLGNLWLANQSGKNVAKVNLPRLTAENVSFAPEREAAIRERDLTRSSIGRNVRDAARARGEYLSNMGAAESSINRGVSDVLGQSYQREALANAQERARVNAANAQIGSQQEMFNVGARNQSLADRNAYLSAAMQGIPMLAKDISAIKQQDALINSLGEDYGIYLQKKPGERKKIIRKYKGGK